MFLILWFQIIYTGTVIWKLNWTKTSKSNYRKSDKINLILKTLISVFKILEMGQHTSKKVTGYNYRISTSPKTVGFKTTIKLVLQF